MLVNLIDLVSSLQQVGPAHGKYKMNENLELSHTTRISLKPERTRFFRSSHPMPPAPTTRIFPFFIRSHSTDGAASAMFRRNFDFEMKFVLTCAVYCAMLRLHFFYLFTFLAFHFILNFIKNERKKMQFLK